LPLGEVVPEELTPGDDVAPGTIVDVPLGDPVTDEVGIVVP